MRCTFCGRRECGGNCSEEDRRLPDIHTKSLLEMEPNEHGFPVQIDFPIRFALQVTPENAETKVKALFQNFLTDLIFAVNNATITYSMTEGLKFENVNIVPSGERATKTPVKH